ncbi:hypothetical protein JHK87_007510 [Glycine soja]|nr:hypothetical protein JHK87_007510 [Glycine soja]
MPVQAESQLDIIHALKPHNPIESQGEGVLGIVIPGCDETYEEPQPEREHEQEQEHDRHQKVRYLRQGDIFAVPPGIPYWTYNYANVSLVVTPSHCQFGKPA